MSGPKGMSYVVVETAEQRERREFAAARAALRSASQQAKGIQAKMRALGLSPVSLDEGTPTTASQCRDSIVSIEATAAHMESLIDSTLAGRTRELRERTLAIALASGTADDVLGLAQRGPKPTAPRSSVTSSRTAEPSAQSLAKQKGDLIAHVTQILDRMQTPDSALFGRAESILQLPVDTANLEIQRLSADVDAQNSARTRERIAQLDRERVLALSSEREAVAASDQKFVLQQVTEVLYELGYAVGGTSVVEPGRLVFIGRDFSGYGVAAGISTDEVVMRPVRVDESAPENDMRAEEELCAQIPKIREKLASRDVSIKRVRSMPPGIIPVPVEAINTRHLQTTSRVDTGIKRRQHTPASTPHRSTRRARES